MSDAAHTETPIPELKVISMPEDWVLDSPLSDLWHSSLGTEEGDLRVVVVGRETDLRDAIMTRVNGYATLQAERDRLAKALEAIMIGGNHLASHLITELGGDFSSRFPPTMEWDEARKTLSIPHADVWVCWRDIMRARAALST